MNNQFTAKKSKKEVMDFINEYLYVDTNGANSIYEYFGEQYSFSEIPNDKKILIEHFSEDRKKVLVFNGEIYNYIELKDELSKKGHKFKTNSDTEVILKAYEEWGYDCQNKLNGMWAFALWDSIFASNF